MRKSRPQHAALLPALLPALLLALSSRSLLRAVLRIAAHRTGVLLLPLAVVAMSSEAAAQQLTVSAAASLTDAFKAIGPLFEASRRGATVRFNFAASGVLLQQISQGAPVDILASADQETIQRGLDRNLLDKESRQDFASNSLVLIEAATGGTGLKDLDGLKSPRVRRIAIGKSATVPVGRYTRQVLEASGHWLALQPKLIQADSVRQVLDYVGRGKVEAGFVYRTDAALMTDRVKVVATVQGHEPIRYPVAVVRDSSKKPLAREFVRFLQSAPAQDTLRRYGFGAP